MKNETDRLEETLAREGLYVPSIAKRIIAYMVDDLLITLFLLVIIWGDVASLQEQNDIIDGEALMAVILTVLPLNLILTFTYHWLLIARFGSTLGKMLCRIRVVDIAMLDNPGYLNAAIRSAVRLLSVMFYFLPFIAIFVDPFLRGFHDKLAKSVAIAIE